MSKFSTELNLTNSDLTGGAAYEEFKGTGTPSGFFVSGTFDSGTVSLEQKIGDEWVAVGSDTTLTESGGGLFTSPISQLRVNVTGAGATFDVDIVVKPLYL